MASTLSSSSVTPLLYQKIVYSLPPTPPPLYIHLRFESGQNCCRLQSKTQLGQWNSLLGSELGYFQDYLLLTFSQDWSRYLVACRGSCWGPEERKWLTSLSPALIQSIFTFIRATSGFFSEQFMELNSQELTSLCPKTLSPDPQGRSDFAANSQILEVPCQPFSLQASRGSWRDRSASLSLSGVISCAHQQRRWTCA